MGCKVENRKQAHHYMQPFIVMYPPSNRKGRISSYEKFMA